MSDAGQEEPAEERRSVLAELPRTRPQRTSSRRKTARTQATAPKTKAKAAPPPPSTPRQGYEAEQEIAGTPVAPPSGTELVGAVAELAGELAQTGIAAGGRLLKGALSRLTRP
jgi:hypothetical protein